MPQPYLTGWSAAQESHFRLVRIHTVSLRSQRSALVLLDAVNKSPYFGTRHGALKLCSGLGSGWPTCAFRTHCKPWGQRHNLLVACLVLGARGSSSTCRQFQSGCLCVVPTPHRRVYFTFPNLAPSPPRPVGRHVARSLSWSIFVAAFLNTRQGGGCKPHACYSMGCMSNP
jgi:hypothetical protein